MVRLDMAELWKAAEITVAAAAAATSWAGSDYEGILAHVATISPSAMAVSREKYEIDQRGAHTYTWYDDSTGFEVAALPAIAAPMWSARVRKAINAAENESRAYKYGSERGGIMDAPADRRRAGGAIVRWYALMACDLWGIYEPPVVRWFQPLTEAIEALTNDIPKADLQP